MSNKFKSIVFFCCLLADVRRIFAVVAFIVYLKQSKLQYGNEERYDDKKEDD